MSSFQVFERSAEFGACRCRPAVPLMRTDDWLAAESFSMSRPGTVVRGTHPTHSWAEGRCTTCGAWENGSYGSHAPCGYDFGGLSLYAHVEAWRDTTETTEVSK